MNPFRMRARHRRAAANDAAITERYAAAIAAREDARGVYRYGLTTLQFKRCRFMSQCADAGLDPFRLRFVGWLIQQGRISDDR